MLSSGLSPIAASVADRIRDFILNGALPSGQALPSERELSLQFGVSRQAIRQAITYLVTFGLLDSKPRCRPVVRPLAHPIEQSSNQCLSVWLWPHLSAFSSSLLFRGIQRAAPRDGSYKFTVGAIAGEQWSSVVEAEANYLEKLAADDTIKGAIVWVLGGAESRAGLKKVQEKGIPLVFVDRLPPEGVAGDFVGTDNYGSSRTAAQHLLQLGHQRIIFAANLDTSSAVQDRLSGWESALKAAGISDRRVVVPNMTMDGDMKAGFERSLKPLFESKNPPTAVMAVNDMVGLIIYDILSNWGISVPRQVSVVGFDGEMRWIPGGGYLTTMVQNFERIGEIAMSLLVERLEKPTQATTRHYLLEAPLADHGSTNPIRSDLLTTQG